MLETVIQYGTGKAAAIGQFAAGKTGTTSNFGDAWFVGWDSQVHGRRLGRLPRQARADDDRLQRRARARRHLPGADLARLHDLGAADRQDARRRSRGEGQGLRGRRGRRSRRRRSSEEAPTRPRPGPPSRAARAPRRARRPHVRRAATAKAAPPAAKARANRRRPQRSACAGRPDARSARPRANPPRHPRLRRAASARAAAASGGSVRRAASAPAVRLTAQRRVPSARRRPRCPLAPSPPREPLLAPRPRARDVAVAGRAEAPGQLDGLGDADARRRRQDRGRRALARQDHDLDRCERRSR